MSTPSSDPLERRTRALQRALHRAVRSAGLTEAAARSVVSDACRPDSGGGAPEVKELLGNLRQRDRERVAALSRALARIETGDYGRCLRCGAEIDDERLDALPEAAVCRGCA